MMRTALAMLVLGGLVACTGGNPDADDKRQEPVTGDAVTLPVPERSRGGVTGMPELPGHGNEAMARPMPVESPLDPTYDMEDDGLADADPGIHEQPAPGEWERAATPRDRPVPAGEPGALEAVAVVRAYYAALGERRFAHAYRLWSDGGRATGQSPQQFADAFGSSVAISAELLEPGRIDAATGARYIEVPVAIADTRHDGSVRRYIGAYTLRRSVVDGASPGQRAWRITSADLREVRP